ncbi:uncharacterized protein LOC133192081 [Saccostrea echinata]|uniref:uncharacterized protein LOC133192081 n=1 Tax=Saccostrea echinata TaxID=191078 RepID=UPI002A7F0A82|nr:uncharacterized protein LOC133192081 [Saccostrea echinata]
MSSVLQVLRQADALKASISDSSKCVSETWVVRQRLEDLYKKLLLMDLEYALDKKVEQDLWNYAFKNHINILQIQTKDRQNTKRGETHATLNLFLETASGFYLQLIQLICTTFKLDLPFRRKSSCFGIMKEKSTLRVKIVPPKKSSCLYVCQYCLVHLGDIARYRQQVEQAQTFYWHAANLVPFNGQPYNQLAIVEAARGNKLTTVFYYIRSLALRHPFPAAATNLEKMYTKLTKDIPELKGKLSVSEMITSFLQLHACIHLCTELDRAAALSSKLLAALPAHVTSQSFPSLILVQIVAINIFSMHHAQRMTQYQDSEEQSDSFNEELGSEELRSFSLMFSFTIGILDLLLQNTPKQEQKLKEFFTLPAVKLLLDWFKLNPLQLQNPILKSSSVMTNLSKVLNNIRLPDSEGSPNISKYDDLPLPEDTELRCFQYLEKAHSSYSYSRLPTEGLPLEVESMLRCSRIYAHGKWLAEETESLNAQPGKSGRLQFTAPLVQRVTMDSEVLFVEKKPVRQNIAIQAIIQKKGQHQATDKSPRVVPTKIQERVKPPLDGAEPVKTTVLTAASVPNSPKYLLGVPTTEPLFMKGTSSGVTSSTRPGTQSSRVPVTQQPPRLQKQIMAQQGSSQLCLWQENVTPQILSKQVSVTPQQQQKLLWPYSVQQQQEQNTSKCDNSSSPQLTQNDASPSKVGQQSIQQTTDSQKSQLLEKQTQNVFLNMNSDFRITRRFPGISKTSSVTSKNTSINARNPIPSQSNTLSGNTTTSAMFRFPPPPFTPNSKQFSSVSFDVPPPPLPQTINMSNLEIAVRPGLSHQHSGHQHSEKNQQKPLEDNAFQQNSTLVNPQRASQMANYTNNPNQQHPKNSPHSGNIGNQMHGGIRNMFQNPPPPSFQQMTPRNERPPFGGTSNDRSPFGGTNSQTVPSQIQNSASQFHLLNQLLNAGIGRMNVRPLGMQSSMENSGKKEDLPFVPPELLGALSQLAIQGTPIHETGNSPNRSPVPGPEVETCAERTGQQPTQQGTYSLFSSSPWSVPLSTADNKNTGSSPFSEETNSVGNSPQSDVMEPKLPQGIDMGLRFGPTEEMWHDKTQKIASLAEQTAASGPGPYFPGPLQSIWSSPGPSPLEKLLEMQKQKKTTDPH